MAHDCFRYRPEIYGHAVDFLITETEVGLTFARNALAARFSIRRERNQANARKAYDSAVDWSTRLSLTDADSHDIGERLIRLKSALEQLGEAF